MFSRNSLRKPSSRAKAVSLSDPLTGTSNEQAISSLNSMEPAADDTLQHRSHEVLRDLKATPVSSTSNSTATFGSHTAKSFPSTGLSRSRKTSAPVSRTTEPATPSRSPRLSESARSNDRLSTHDEEEEVSLPHDSLGRRMWQHFQAAAEQSDLRDMVADNATALLVLPVNAHSEEADLEALLNDNALFLEAPVDQDTEVKFTSVSGICGKVDRGSISALGVLPPMEDLMQVVSESESPRTTLFDALDDSLVNGPPLQRLRVLKTCKNLLPDGKRVVQMVVTRAPLERRMVVDSAVTTLSTRMYEAIDATYAALLPQAPAKLMDSDRIKVDVEEIMQFAQAIELREHNSRTTRDTSAARRLLQWIAGSKAATMPSPQTSAQAVVLSANIDADAETWQLCMVQFQEHIMAHLDELEDETSMCGDTESRRKLCAALLECVEKLVMEALYPRLFSPSFSDDRAQDEQFASKVAALNMAGITLTHLGLAKSLASNSELLRICAETGRLLDRIDGPRSPAEKLKLIVDAHRCVVDRMQVLNDRLKRASQPEENSQSELSADSILPLLIFAVVKCNPRRFISNLRFIQRFRTQSLLASEFDYCMTNTQAVASFVGSVDARKLGLSAQVSSGALERVLPPALSAMRNLLVNNVVSSVGIDVMQGVAGGGKKVAVNVYDATLGRLIDSSTQLISKASSQRMSDRELEGHEQKEPFDKSQVISGVRDVLDSASRQLSYEIKGHLPRSSPGQQAKPQVIDRFVNAQKDDLKIGDIDQLLASYKELASYISKL
ncbi:hypothetical protein EV183_004212 [Coemansia sp. RSA 2336]|nr:hypothetical protein EV183_004212 [Coemansia sp. RSA 2336]